MSPEGEKTILNADRSIIATEHALKHHFRTAVLMEEASAMEAHVNEAECALERERLTLVRRAAIDREAKRRELKSRQIRESKMNERRKRIHTSLLQVEDTMSQVDSAMHRLELVLPSITEAEMARQEARETLARAQQQLLIQLRAPRDECDDPSGTDLSTAEAAVSFALERLERIDETTKALQSEAWEHIQGAQGSDDDGDAIDLDRDALVQEMNSLRSEDGNDVSGLQEKALNETAIHATPPPRAQSYEQFDYAEEIADTHGGVAEAESVATNPRLSESTRSDRVLGEDQSKQLTSINDTGSVEHLQSQLEQMQLVINRQNEELESLRMNSEQPEAVLEAAT